MQWLWRSIAGFCMGIADTIPGISGATIAFILGFYPELVTKMKVLLSPRTAQALVQGRWRALLKRLSLRFFIPISLGTVVAVLAVAPVLLYLINNYTWYTYGFFIGLLLLVSIQEIWWLYSQSKGRILSAMVVISGLLVAIGIGQLREFSLTNLPGAYGISGGIAAFIGIVPGISGSFFLLLVGMYERILEVFATVKDVLLLQAPLFENIGTIGLLLQLLVGMLIGVTLSSHSISWLYDRYEVMVRAAITGLMLGSAVVLLPWPLVNRVIETVQLSDWLRTSVGVMGGLLFVVLIMLIKRKRGRSLVTHPV